MGADNMSQLHRWHNWRFIMENYPIGVLARPGQRISARMSRAARAYADARIKAQFSRTLAQATAPSWCFVNVPMVDLSSTNIRLQGGWDYPS